MGNGEFFVSWELWQQMTFVLGCAIIVVFCIGTVKLAWTNAIMRKQEVLDEEKRARISEMRRTGLGNKGGHVDVPFGIRAIQTGVEVDGIWISRPSTPMPASSTTKLAAATTLADSNDPSLATGKVKIMVAEPQQVAASSTEYAAPAAHHLPSGLNVSSPGFASHGAGPSTSASNPHNLTPPSRQKSTRLRSDSAVNNDALMMLEGRSARPGVQSYVPKPAGPLTVEQQERHEQLRQQRQQAQQQHQQPPQPQVPQQYQHQQYQHQHHQHHQQYRPQQQQHQQSQARSQRESGESGESASTYSSNPSNPNVSVGAALSAGLGAFPPAPNGNMGLHGVQGYTAVQLHSPARTPAAEIVWNPFDGASTRTMSAHNTPSMASTPHMTPHLGGHYGGSETQLPLLPPQHQQYQQQQQQQQIHQQQYNQQYGVGPSVPEPTFGPGDLHVNRKSRKVNAGFEVLPAGTFGVPHEFVLSPALVEASRGGDAQDEGDDQSGNRFSRVSQRLRKKSLNSRKTAGGQ